MTYLCVPIFVTEMSKARRDIAAAARAGADIIELRVDKLPAGEDLRPVLADCPIPAIVTCRAKWEGGFSESSDLDRAACLAMGIKSGARYADLEIKSNSNAKNLIADVRREHFAPLIISFHDFTAIPDDLCKMIDQMNLISADVNKIVWTARNIRENLEAFGLLKKPSRPTIALCMGEAGLISRVLAKKFGAFLTFASLDDSEATAPGQVTISDLRNLYRWDAIKPSTKVFGVVAHPVRHSMSPAIHNAAFTEVGFDGVYLPMLVEPDYESFKSFIDGFQNFEGMNLSGLSVTIPHKENALRYLKETGSEIEELGERIGAINTISIERPGKLSGKNTDYAAILDSITEALGIDRDQLKICASQFSAPAELAGRRSRRWRITARMLSFPIEPPTARNCWPKSSRHRRCRWTIFAAKIAMFSSTQPLSGCSRGSTRIRWPILSRRFLTKRWSSTRSTIR